MKLNFKTISLSGIAALALLATPLAMMHSAQADGGRGQRFEQLDLTEAQSTQIEAIHQDAREQMQTVLTDEQRATLENSEEGRRAWRSLDLSEDQRDQLRAIKDSSREEMQGVLTDDQRQQMEELRQERGEGRGDRRASRRDQN